jgi:LacI family transcriptional regulator
VVTLDDVARESGLSRSTVSRVLNDDPRVSPEARVRVRDVAQALGYRPNRAARSLATGRSGVIGLVMPVMELWDDPYGAHVVQDVCGAAAEQGIGVMVWLTRAAPKGAVEEILRNGIVDGLVISSLAQKDSWVEELLDGSLPAVLVGRHPTRVDVSWVDIDHRAGVAALMDHLVSIGRRRIATITGPMDRHDAAERYRAYADALARHGLPLDPDLVAHADFRQPQGAEAMRALLAHRPDAVLAANDETAHAAIGVLLAAGLRVPEDVAVTGFDDLRRSAGMPLTTVRHDVAAIAGEALDVLVGLLRGEPGPEHRMLPATIVLRSSTVATATG